MSKTVTLPDMIKEIMRKKGFKTKKQLVEYIKKKYGFDPLHADYDLVFSTILLEYSELE